MEVKSTVSGMLALLTIIALAQIRITIGGIMHHMMEKMMHKHHEEKGHSISFKPIAIPIPIPIAYVDKGHMKAPNPWPQESKAKGMMWEMMKMKMKMKMKMMKKMKKAMKGMKGKKCCPMQHKMGMQMKAWPMKKPQMMCPQMMMMECDMPVMKGCNMKAGWPAPMPAMCDEEEMEEEEEEEDIEEDWPDYYEGEMEEEQNAWDTKAFPVYAFPDKPKTIKMKRRGDDLDEEDSSSLKDRILWVRVKRSFRSKAGSHKAPRKSFEYDFDYV